MMQVEAELARLSPGKDTLLTIGVFDGVHLGHKYLISRLLDEAAEKKLFPGVVTFFQHPQQVVSPESGLSLLTSPAEKSQLIRDEGVSLIIPLSFTPELAALGARRFTGLLQKHLGMRGLVVGADFALGRGREGDINTLRRLGEETGFTVSVVAPAVVAGEVVSSTAVRRALAEGDMDRVCRMTGRYFILAGNVVSGTGWRGTELLGFPTANLEMEPARALPPDGVYAGWAYLEGKAYQAVTNIGSNPTFGGGARTVETYIIDYQGDLYGRELRVEFIQRLRGERKFASAQALKEQIAEDVRQGRAILSTRSAV